MTDLYKMTLRYRYRTTTTLGTRDGGWEVGGRALLIDRLARTRHQKKHRERERER